eukprot:gene15476-11068_t
MTSHRPTKNEKRRLRKKEEKEKKDEVVGKSGTGVKVSEPIDGEEDEIVVEYVAASLEDEVGADSSMLDMFKDVFSKFTKPEELLSADTSRNHEDNDASENALVPSEESKAGDQLSEADVKKLSKRKKKLVTRLSVAELKQLVNRPDVVEAHDVSSSNPRLLIHLKSSRNAVAVPRHWCHIRKYLQGKRGIEKIPFQLPEFIAETGIARIRESIMEQEALQKSKQKARNRIRPKMGRIDIDYQVLHDAFFKHQTKPKLSGHGDLYYEGKEFEVTMKEKKPGVLSPELLAALGMQDGAPPPWLINMQRYGPPPSYPNLRIPGLNAPLPSGASYGSQPGQWGQPPVDQYGRPLYGDPFGTSLNQDQDVSAGVDKKFLWGSYEYEEEEQEEEEEEEEEEDDEADDEEHATQRGRGDASAGTETPATIADSSWISGLDATESIVDLRKRMGGLETPDTQQRELYQVIKESKGQAGAGGQIFGSDRLYSLPGHSNGDVSVKIGQGRDGTETEEDAVRGSRKRKAEESLVSKKAKEFKF